MVEVSAVADGFGLATMSCVGHVTGRRGVSSQFVRVRSEDNDESKCAASFPHPAEVLLSTVSCFDQRQPSMMCETE